MAVATFEDVAVALGRPISTEAEQAQVEWWLTGLEHVIRARLGDLAELDQDVLMFVEVEAAVAKINRAGRSESSVTVSVDDGSVTRRYEDSVGTGDITDAWWSLLDVDSGLASASIRPSFEADDVAWAVNTPPSPYLDPTWRTL